MVIGRPFEKGKPKPADSGRRKGVPNKRTVRERLLIAEGADKEIVDKTVAAAKAGDLAAQALYYRFLRPPRPRVNRTPIEANKPRTIEEVREVNADLLVKTLAGELDLDAATVASALLKVMETSIVGVDLAQLLDELKAKAR
jgi:hypothetical protein